ncbi:hypothetical protein B0T14DRAFT_604976 [Immersiella caudata]|uniref:Uncharacterized protein n=1 Tax=Immersiella caudata TaxID=314043 RepID=A0AA39WJW8_9PEZI|nr:hypothetical protein B0T14DRAFT_604976 [Immersiella caudata]
MARKHDVLKFYATRRGRSVFNQPVTKVEERFKQERNEIERQITLACGRSIRKVRGQLALIVNNILEVADEEVAEDASQPIVHERGTTTRSVRLKLQEGIPSLLAELEKSWNKPAVSLEEFQDVDIPDTFIIAGARGPNGDRSDVKAEGFEGSDMEGIVKIEESNSEPEVEVKVKGDRDIKDEKGWTF